VTLLCAIDAGLRKCGVSVFCEGRLVWAGLIHSSETIGRGPFAWRHMAAAVVETVPNVDALVVEQMQYDRRTDGKAHDVFEVSGVVTALLRAFATAPGAPSAIETPRPADWKGQVSKAVTEARVKAALSPEELGNLESWNHNVIDAAAIGLWSVRRRGERR
jgi:hypothetical protein